MITIDAAVLERKHQLPFVPQIGVAAGTLANFMSACIAGLLV